MNLDCPVAGLLQSNYARDIGGILSTPELNNSMTDGSTEEEEDEAYCPRCETGIETVSVAQLKGDKSNTVVKFWTCSECQTILGPTG